jgi:hypothetical protein
MLRTIHRLSAGLVLAAATLFRSTLSAEVEITHKPVDEVQAGSRVVLQAEVEDEKSGVDLVRAYFCAGQGEDYVSVGITVNYEVFAGGPVACLEVTDPCGNIMDSNSGPVSCGVGNSNFIVLPGSESVDWSPAPPGTYAFDVIYCGASAQGAPLDFSGDIQVSQGLVRGFSGTLNTVLDRQSDSFVVP